MARLEGLAQLRNLVISSGIEPATFQLVRQPTAVQRNNLTVAFVVIV
jgi:hypothetical protein